MDSKIALGVDIGGTTVSFAVVNESGDLLFQDVAKTKSFDTPDKMIDHIYHAVEQSGYAKRLDGIGVGAPNGNHFTGTIEYAPNLQWKGIIPLKQLFEDRFNCKTVLTNDANAAAIGEMLFGKAKQLSNFVTITLGTGLGSGIVVDRKIVYGAHGFAGEYGHIVVIPDGRTCGCGRKGCLESYASSTGVVKSIAELDSVYEADVKKLRAISNLTSKDVAIEAQNGNEFAKEIIDYTAKILGFSLANFQCFSDPEAYVLFGGCANLGQPFADRVKQYMEDFNLNIYKGKAEVLISGLQEENAAVLGNAAMILKDII